MYRGWRDYPIVFRYGGDWFGQWLFYIIFTVDLLGHTKTF